MKRILAALCIVVATTNGYAQETDTTKAWKTGGVTTLQFQQVSLTNWVAGGINAISGNALVNLFANYSKGRSTWDNSVDLGFGLTKQGDEGKVIKNDDKIDLSSKFGKYAFEHWYYSALANFRTQFAEGYNYPNDSVRMSEFLAPAYGLLAFGMDYKPNDNLSVLMAPVTGKFTIVNNADLANAGAFGVEPAEYDPATGLMIKPGNRLRKEFGGYVKVIFRKTILENITLQTKLDLFSNYLENPGNIDINWDNLISMKVNKYISANLNTTLLYDHDVQIAIDNNDDEITDATGPRTQFRQLFGVGFTYKF